MEAATWGLIGTLVGAMASIATSWIATKSEAGRQAQADSLERIERSRAFQRATLIELQETLQAAMRNLGRMFSEDHDALKRNGKWTREFYSDELDKQVLETNTRLNVLTERVADDGIRDGAKVVRSHINAYILTPSESEARSAVDAAMMAFSPLMQEIGRVLRSLY